MLSAHASPTSLLAALLLGAALLLPGCGLAQPEIGFRSYPLRDVEFDAGTDLVRDVARRFVTERFGGVAMAWDDVDHNLKVDPIYDDSRRLSLYLHLAPSEQGLDVQMFALVEHLTSRAGAGRVWGDPAQDVHLEQMLYEAILSEYLARREVGVTP